MTIKEMIDRSGYSIVELSKLSNVSRPSIYKLLKGGHATNRILFKLTKALGYTLDDLK